MLDQKIVKEIEKAAGRDGVREAPMKHFTSFGCGGPAAFMITAENSLRLAGILRILEDSALPWFVIGKGTNLLVSDEGFPGVIINLSGELDKCLVDGSKVICGAGALLPGAARLAARSDLSGLEPLAHIPGTLGGAVAMNAGAHGSAIGDLVEWVEICTPGQCRRMGRADMEFGYRASSLASGAVIARVKLSLRPANGQEIHEAMIAYRKQRQATQPRGSRTFGSVFKNPSLDQSAGSLMDKAGCKELSFGGAAVSRVHANFIVNKGNATASEVVKLMNACRQRVFEKFGLVLEPEVRFLGNIGLDDL